jgi:hypothetical protein
MASVLINFIFDFDSVVEASNIVAGSFAVDGAAGAAVEFVRVLVL